MHRFSFGNRNRRSSPFSLLSVFGLAVAVCSAAGARPRAQGATYWTGSSGGYTWRFTTKDITTTGRRPALSLWRKLVGKAEGELEGYTAYRISVEPMSLVGSLLCYRRDDYWEGGAHPSGAIGYDHVDAARPGKTLKLTDLFPDATVRDALWNDKIVRKVLTDAGVTTKPATSKALAEKLKFKTFSDKEGEIEYGFNPDLLSEFSFHHLEGDKVAVRLCVPWGAEVYRFQYTEIGLLLPIPARLRAPLRAAAAGRSGFLGREAKRRFKDRETSLFDTEEK